MDYSLKDVAGRIKDLREAKGYTQEELAKLTGVSVEDYMVLEKGETDFSFTFIYKCAKACGVEVVDLLEGTSTTLSSFAITRKGEGLKILKKMKKTPRNVAVFSITCVGMIVCTLLDVHISSVWFIFAAGILGLSMFFIQKNKTKAGNKK